MSDRVTLEDLMGIVAERAAADPADSYTASLVAKGIERTAKKFGEESVEAVIAAVSGSKDDLTSEIADVLYHLAVLVHASDVTLDDVHAELARRTAQSGHAEKASREKG